MKERARYKPYRPDGREWCCYKDDACETHARVRDALIGLAQGDTSFDDTMKVIRDEPFRKNYAEMPFAVVWPEYSNGRRKPGRPRAVHHWEIGCKACAATDLRPDRFWHPKAALLKIAAEHNEIVHGVMP